MAIFKAFCGKQFTIEKNNGYQTGIIIGKTYPNDMKDYNEEIPLECQQCSTRKNTYSARHRFESTSGTFPVTKTICFATNTSHKEYPLVEKYLEPCTNTREKYLFEIILQSETFRAYLTKEIPTRGITAFEVMKDIAETIWSDYKEEVDEYIEDAEIIESDTMIVPMIDMERGTCNNLEINGYEELEKLIISIRLIGYKQSVID